MVNIKISKTSTSRFDSINWDNLGFGNYFSDHVYISDYKNGKWNDGEIVPYGPMPIEPGMCTLHYGQTIFEGMKAFRSVKGGVNFFRPEKNAQRLNKSAEILCIPEFNVQQFLDAMVELIKLDEKFIPKTRGQSLYIRPLVYGSSNFLGVHASAEYRLIIMTSPVGSYYAEGLNPVKIMVTDEFVRAVPGGIGKAKTAGNYAASLLAGKKAKENGFSQVLWLNAKNREVVDEVGAMNIMFVINDELITPPLTQGTILAGITRSSVLDLAREWGMKVSERSITIDEIIDANKKGTLQECFGTGTAAVISPVGLLHYKGTNTIVNNNTIGKVSQKMYDTITGIQYGEIEDNHGWVYHIDV